MKVNFKIMLIAVFLSGSICVQAMDHMLEIAAQSGAFFSTIYVGFRGYDNRTERVRLHNKHKNNGEIAKAARFADPNNELWPCMIQAASVAALGLNLIMETPEQRMIVSGGSLLLTSAAARMQYCNNQKLDHDKQFVKADCADYGLKQQRRLPIAQAV